MKVKLQNPLPADTGYPYVGINRDGLLVLFTKKNTGVTLKGNSNYEAGEYRDDWLEKSQFNPVNHEVVIVNER